MAAALGALDRAIRAALVAIVAVMVVVVFAQVVARYGLNASIPWADEVARLAFVATVFLGIAVAARARAHIGITLLASALPRRARAPLQRLVLAVSAALAALVAWEAAAIAAEQWDERMISLDVSAAWFLVPVVAGMAVAALNLLAAALAREAAASGR
jgi:TRAP-type C4-dicarboxylate transport system permease small subunit